MGLLLSGASADFSLRETINNNLLTHLEHSQCKIYNFVLL